MKVIPYTLQLREEWDDFCLNDQRAWFWHTSAWMRYCENSSFNIQSSNHSFLIIKNNKLLAIVPLFIETRTGKYETEFTFAGAATPIYLIKQDLSYQSQKECHKVIAKTIREIGVKHRIKRGHTGLTFMEQTEYVSLFYKYLLSDGFIDTTTFTSIIYLDKAESQIVSRLSDNHRRNIRKADKLLTYHFYDDQSITKENFHEFTCSYFRIAGKQTRPDHTFACLYDYIKNKNGYLFYARYLNRIIGYVYIITYKKSAYYALGGNEREFPSIPVAHGLHWAIIKFLNKQGFQCYDIGLLCHNDLFQVYSEKEKNISRFKREFGGRIIPRYSGEYFYDKEYFIKLTHKRLSTYTDFTWGE